MWYGIKVFWFMKHVVHAFNAWLRYSSRCECGGCGGMLGVSVVDVVRSLRSWREANWPQGDQSSPQLPKDGLASRKHSC